MLHLRTRFLESISLVGKASSSIRLWWAVCLILAAILAWDGRHYVNPDGDSYVEMASEAVNGGGPSKLVNGYWSPGYPALIGIALWIFRPRPALEFPLVHLVNFFIFGLALSAFTFFLRCSLLDTGQAECLNRYEKRLIIPFAFCTFLWFMVEFIGLDLVAPDLCVAAVVFLVAGVVSRLLRPDSTWKHAVALGCALGAGCYTKAAMLPLCLALLGILFLKSSLAGEDLRKLLTSASVFLLVLAPLVALTSGKVGRVSFGEAGRLNYAWFVNGLQHSVGWTGGSSLYGVPEHPPRRLMETPLTLEFAAPLNSTYPLWSDPSYWYAGARVSFHLRQQIRAITENLDRYEVILFRMTAFVAGALVLWMLSLHRETLLARAANMWWQVAWSVAACFIYVLVHIDFRFVAPFLVLFWLAIYRILLMRSNWRDVAIILATVLCTVMGILSIDLMPTLTRTARDFLQARQTDYELLARSIRDLGLQKDDRIALVGSAFYPSYAYPYYARIDHLHVVAQIPDSQEFWRLSRGNLNSLLARLATIGVKAVVATDRPHCSAPANWQDFNATSGERFGILSRDPNATGGERFSILLLDSIRDGTATESASLWCQ